MLRTKSGLPRNCSWNEDRHGKRRIRFRKNGFTTYLTGTPWSEEFMRQYAAALDGLKARCANVGAERTKPGSFNALCVSYYQSPDFRGLKNSTQGSRRNIIERLRREHGDKPLRLLKREHVSGLIGARASTPQAANNLLKVLRVVMAYAVTQGMLESNPAAGVKRYKTRGNGLHSWTEDEIAGFEARHPIGSKARLALALLLYTAQRRSDVARIGWQHVRGDVITVRQEKTGAHLSIPMASPLVEVLSVCPRTNLTFLVTERGAPFSPAGFGNWFRERCNEAGLPPRCAAHGLRKAACRRMVEAGCSSEQVKAISGHRTLSEVARYTAAADQEKLARSAMLLVETDREQALSNLSNRLDKTAAK